MGICLVLQIVTGLFLRFYYTSFREERFSRVVLIMKEVWGGWALRLSHVNGASLFFLMIYCHIARGVFYIRSNNKKTWNSGVAIFLILIMISFIGYVLPWGQMSYWAVSVITNLFSVIPIVGDSLVSWIWGGFSVSKPTLTRFYSIHFLTPLILASVTAVHLALLHRKGGSRNQIGVPRSIDKISFHPYFTVKDTYFILALVSLSLWGVSQVPYLTMDPENNIPANPMQTPLHIQPEWYFLSFYTILRAMPRKSSGVLIMLLSILILSVISIIKVKFSMKFRFYRKTIFWSLLARFLALIELGTLPAEEPYIRMGVLWTLIYFMSATLINL